ncbi:MAG: hypothetical protein VB088_12750 [Sphaerochaeta sp.]|uniref:Uncharacterized protein n=1 Tax=bioreactor metagenome TaxID=1076179 RepID=A0A645A660_9ZZZZ|nr:hypothetical protein [Sphaerochaeta sp.]
MSLDPFIPVKITDRVWAERLLDGEVFMRSLHAFGSWSVVEQNQSEPVKNSYRGDLHEGAVAIYKDARDHSFIKDGDPEFLDIIHQITDIDADDLQYFKIFSLYAMRYDHKNNHFFLPDRRIKSFGDTAIVISDMDCLLRRILQQILNDHGELVQFLLDLVQYFDYQESTKLYPLFSKQQRYDYQNELRVAIGLLEPNKYSTDFSNSLIRSTEPLKLDIGDIRDIAFALSIDDFLKLRFPSNISLRFPMSNSTKPSTFDMIVQDTRKTLEHRVSPFVKPTVTIW